MPSLQFCACEEEVLPHGFCDCAVFFASHRRRSRSLSDFRTFALLAATDETKDDVSHPREKARRKKAGTDDFQVGLRSKPHSPALNHQRSASDGVFAKETLFIPAPQLTPM
jgi:hypothetical protein